MKLRSFRRFRGDRTATTAVEFAILALPLLMLVFGILEFGRALWVREALQMTAVQAARCMGILSTSCSSSGSYSVDNTRSYIENLAAQWGVTLTTSNLTTVTRNSSNSWCQVSGTGLSEVTISYTFQSPLGSLISALASGLSLSGHACYPNDS